MKKQSGDNPDKGGQRKRSLTHLKSVFLEHLGKKLFITQACEAAGIGRATIYEWRDADPEFRKQIEEVEAKTLDILRSEAFRRAVIGVEEPVFHNGKQIATVTKASDYLLDRMLRAKDPAFKDNMRVDIHVNFLNVLIAKVQDIIQRVAPISCPHCHKVLPVRKDLSREFAMLGTLDVSAASQETV